MAKVGAPYQKHRRTSKAAAVAIVPHLNRLQALLLELLEEAGARGLTDNQMQKKSGLSDNTQVPRRIELLRDFKLIAPSGRKRKTSSGNPAIVWVLRRYNPHAPTGLPRERDRKRREKALEEKIVLLREANADLQMKLAKCRQAGRGYRKKCREAGLV